MFTVDKLSPELMRKYRLYLNFSQDTMAKLLGVSRKTYNQWENDSQMPESSQMVCLAFEALLNRKIIAETEKLYLEKFKEQTAETSKILANIDQMQKMRVSRKSST